jgi:hypothetical protein
MYIFKLNGWLVLKEREHRWVNVKLPNTFSVFDQLKRLADHSFLDLGARVPGLIPYTLTH